MFQRVKILVLPVFAVCAYAQLQTAPSVSQVLTWSTLTTTNIQSQSPLFAPTTTGSFRSLLSVYTESRVSGTPDAFINTPGNYSVANPNPLNSAINSSVALALSLIPVASPASAVISKTDSVTGAPLPVRRRSPALGRR